MLDKRRRRETRLQHPLCLIRHRFQHISSPHGPNRHLVLVWLINKYGTLVQSSSYHGEDHAIHLFTLCNNDSGCDWVELNGNLTNMRWYASSQLLPNNRVIVVSGRGVFTYEFYPRKDSLPSSFYLSLLRGTIDNSEENNLYLFLHLLPGSNLFIFANKRSISFDYMNNKVVKEFHVYSQWW